MRRSSCTKHLVNEAEHTARSVFIDSTSRLEAVALLTITLLSLILSGISPHDRFTWLLEVLPVLIALPLLLATYRSFPLTPLLYRLLTLHALVLMVGGHYTYAQVPLGFWLQDTLDFSRNHYDRIGHLMQGFVPAMLAREILLRRTPLRPGKCQFFTSPRSASHLARFMNSSSGGRRCPAA